MPRRLAAVDIGTNSFHLVVADVKANGKFTVLGRDKEVVRLGEGMTDMKHLSAEAIGRAMRALARFVQIAESHDAPLRAVATSAVREAENRAAFIDRARAELGIEIEVVSGVEEARLIYLGVLQALPVYQKRIVMTDIGGGSTEFLVGERGEVLYANSLKLGAVRLTRRFFETGVRRAAVEECRAFLAAALHPVRRSVAPLHPVTAVGSSGTILNAAMMARAARGETDSFEPANLTLTRRELDALIAALLEAGTVQRIRALPGLDPARADIVVAGTLILEQIFAQLGLQEITTSKYALREGVLLDTIHKSGGSERATAHLRDIRRASVEHLAEIYHVESRHAHAVARYVLALFDDLRPLHGLGPAEREYLEAAAILHDAGYHIAHAQHHLHSYYLIRHSELLGFTDREIEIVANTARYHRKSHPKASHPDFIRLSARDQDIVRRLAALLRVADGLDRRHKAVFRAVHAERRGRALHITAAPARDTDVSIELWSADLRKDLLEEVFGMRVTVERG